MNNPISYVTKLKTIQSMQPEKTKNSKFTLSLPLVNPSFIFSLPLALTWVCPFLLLIWWYLYPCAQTLLAHWNVLPLLLSLTCQTVNGRFYLLLGCNIVSVVNLAEHSTPFSYVCIYILWHHFCCLLSFLIETEFICIKHTLQMSNLSI